MENNTTYEHTEEIDLVALFFTLLHKYRQLFAGAVICAVLLGAAGAVKSTLNERSIEKALAEGKEVPVLPLNKSTKRKWSRIANP